FLTYQRDTIPDEKSFKKTDQPAKGGFKKKGGGGVGGGIRAREFGTDLVLRDLQDHSERSFADVLDYTLSKDGRPLVDSVAAKRPQAMGLFDPAPAQAAFRPPVLTAPARTAGLAWKEKKTGLAFLSDRGEAPAPRARPKLAP